MKKILIFILLASLCSFNIDDRKANASLTLSTTPSVSVCTTTPVAPNPQTLSEQVSGFFAAPLATQWWPARWQCGTWSAFHGWLYIGSDLTIALSYFLIPFVLLYFLYKRKERSDFQIVLGLFVLFILACGLTHLMDASMFWWPAYRLSALLRFATAIVSLGTAFMLIKITPKLIQYRSPEALEEIVKERTEELRKSMLLISAYQRALDESAIVAITDQQGMIKHVNENFCKISKYSKEELIGKDHRLINSGYHDKEFIKNLWTTITNGKIWKGELKNKAKDGIIYWVDTTIVPFLNDTGKPYQYVAIRSDITERKKLEEQQAVVASIVNSSEDAIISKNLEGIITSWNHGAEKQFGYSLEEITGKHISIIIPPHLQNEEKEIIEKIRSGNSVDLYETERIRKDKKIIQVSLTISPIKDLKGNIIGASKISRDISEKKNLENLLDKSNRLAKIGNWEADLIKETVYWSAVTKDIHEVETGYVPNLSQGLSFYKEGESRDRITQCVQACIEQGTAWDEELQIVTAKGNLKWIRTIGNAEFQEGKCIRFYGSFQDIDDRKKAEIEKTLLINNTDESFTLLDSALTIVTFNNQFYNLYNTYFDRIVEKGKSIMEYAQPERIETVKVIYANVMAGKTEESELTLLAQDGSTKTFSLKYKPAKNDNNEIIGVFVTCREITESKEAEEKILKLNTELSKNERRFRGLIENSYDIVSISDSSFKPIYRSPAAVRITGWTDEERKTRGGMEDIHPDDLASHTSIMMKLKDHPGISYPVSFRIKHKKGHYIFLEGMMTNLLQTDPINGIVGNFRDVTETRKAEEELIRERALLRALIDNLPDYIYVKDIQSRHLVNNRSNVELLGALTEKETIGKSLADIFGYEQASAYLKDDQRVFNSGDSIINQEETMVSPAGNLKYLLTTKVPLRDERNSVIGLVGISRDITWQKLAEEKIAQSEKIYRTIASSIPGSVICLFDSDFRYILIEGDMLEKAGYSKDILLGNKAEDVLPPERFLYVKDSYDRVFRGESFSVETTREYFDFITHFVPLKNKDNEVYLAMSVGLDVTKLKKAERAIAELNVGLEQKVIERTNQLESVNKELESFSYSVSHDLRAPLRAVDGYSKMLEEDYSDELDENGKRLLRIIQENAKQMGQLIDDLLTFSRLGRKEVQKAEVNMMILTEDVVQEIKIIYPKAQIKIDMLHPVWGDIALLKQVLFNYISNAVKYSSKSQNPLVKIKSRIVNEEIVYSVTDNGTGFDMHYAHKLFQVFQRLHSNEEFEGTGVGLAIVDRIIKKHHGKVWAEGEIEKGATFYFSLPSKQVSIEADNNN